jgi:glyceraldehyde-3-phosphate dehydrogenase (NADP+)
VEQPAKARIINPGGGMAAATLFYPAVVFPMRDGMKRYHEEQFAWWCRLMPFEDIETALEYVTTCEHGPAQVSIFSSNPDRIGTPIDSLVNQVNRPVRMRTEV